MLFKLYTTVAAQPVGFTVTPAGDAVDALNAEAGQLPVADPIPITYAHPLAGWTHVADAPGRTIVAVNVNVYGLPACAPGVCPGAPGGAGPRVCAYEACAVEPWHFGLVPLT